MKLEFDTDVAEFSAKALPYLQEKPSLHSFIISLLNRYRQSGKTPHLMVRGLRDGVTTIVGLQTEPDRQLILSDGENADLLATRLAEKVPSLKGAHGPTPTVDTFANQWSAEHEVPLRLQMNLRLFELTSVTPARPCGGRFRLAQPQDEELILIWIKAFMDEAVPNDPRLPEEEIRKEIRESTEKQQYFIWEDGGRPVCLLGSKRETAIERWIAPVYTPPELRGRGYGAALVAEVSRRIVAAGKRGMLFTDLANPTSNSIYQKVGYYPLADFKLYLFSK